MPETEKQNTVVRLQGVSTPRMDEYFGLWAIESGRGLAMFERVARMDIAEHVESSATPRPSAGIKGFRVVASRKADDGGISIDEAGDDAEDTIDTEATAAGNIAVLDVRGTLMKQQSSLDCSTSTVVLRKQCRDLMSDSNIDGVIIVIDSPGGSVSGTAEAAQAIKDLSAAKPVIGFVEDLCASAAEWLASQCDEVYANHGTALVGSIGTFIGTYDYSGYCKKEGIKAKLYGTGPLKGAGFFGAEITPEQDAYFQNIVDQTQKFFTQAVADGRELSVDAVNKLATGGVFMADEAKANGLIDGIQAFDQCVARMGELIAQRAAVPTPGAAAGNSQEDRMSKDATTAPEKGTGTAAPASAAEKTIDHRAEMKRYIETFGASGGQWYAEGKTFEEATALHNKTTADAMDALKKRNAELEDENGKLKSRVQELRGSPEAVDAGIAPEAAAGKDAKQLSNRVGANLAKVAQSIKLPKTSNN